MYTFEIFRDWRGQFRWRLLGKLGRVIATSDTSYRSEQIATRALQDLRAGLVDADVMSERRAA
jgi:uncharacterized protein YegP (UPF0339 family)